MYKTEIQTLPKFFDRYINQVDSQFTLLESFENSLKFLESGEFATLESIQLHAYAAGKWTINQILQHLIDVERIFAYRALRFARNDKTELHGFDEDSFAAAANTSQRDFQSLKAELIAVRQSTILLFQSFDNEILARVGIANKVDISVLAIGFAVIGHQNHHVTVIKERYL